jgi:hypothetical protein
LGRCSCSVETEERPRDGETSFPHGERKTNEKECDSDRKTSRESEV